jgi:hypothetical protein
VSGHPEVIGHCRECAAEIERLRAHVALLEAAVIEHEAPLPELPMPSHWAQGSAAFDYAVREPTSMQRQQTDYARGCHDAWSGEPPQSPSGAYLEAYVDTVIERGERCACGHWTAHHDPSGVCVAPECGCRQ